MFNKAERARRVAAQEYHDRSYKRIVAHVTDIPMTADGLEQHNARARFHRKQAELWEKHIKAFDKAALATAKLVGRK